MNPDLGFGRSISYEAHLKHALIQMETGRKGDDSAVPRDKPIISPRTVSAGEGPLEKRGGGHKFLATRESSLTRGCLAVGSTFPDSCARRWR